MPYFNWPYPSLLDEVTRMHESLERMSRAGTSFAGAVFPPINIHDDGESFLVRAEIPGVDKDSMEIDAKGDTLTLRGERKVPAAGEKSCYHRRERESGRFRRVVTLPERIDPSKVTARYRSGILEVLMPRAAEVRPQKIPVA